MQFITIFIISISLLGCASLGPTSAPNFKELVKAPIPSDSGEVLMSGPGQWLPNTIGFTDTKSTGITAGQDPVAGVLVITDSAIFVEQWDTANDKFRIMKRFLLSQVKELNLDTYGANRRVAIQWDDYSNDSFLFMSDSGQWINAKKTESLFEFLSTNKKNK